MIENKLVISGSLIPSSKNTPLDARTRISTISKVSDINVPFIGMIFYVEDEDVYYKVLTLKSKKVGPIESANAVIDKYEPLINPEFATETYVQTAIADLPNIKEQLNAKVNKFTVGNGIDYTNDKINLVIDPVQTNAIRVFESGLCVQIDTTESNGISLSLNDSGQIAIHTDLDTIADAVISKHEIIPDTAETVTITSVIGNLAIGTSVQSVLENMETRLSDSVVDVIAGSGINIDSTNTNNPKISVNIKEGSSIASNADGLDLI